MHTSAARDRVGGAGENRDYAIKTETRPPAAEPAGPAPA